VVAHRSSLPGPAYSYVMVKMARGSQQTVASGFSVHIISGTVLYVRKTECMTWMPVLARSHIHNVLACQHTKCDPKTTSLYGVACRTRHVFPTDDGSWRRERARDSMADRQSRDMSRANFVGGYRLRAVCTPHTGKIGQHWLCRVTRRPSAVSGDLGVSPYILNIYIKDLGLFFL
jgi:hypothetical protein